MFPNASRAVRLKLCAVPEATWPASPEKLKEAAGPGATCTETLHFRTGALLSVICNVWAPAFRSEIPPVKV